MFNLNIDQMGELYAEIMDIFGGKRSSKDFVGDITDRLEIDAKSAVKIAQEVNKVIFQVIKSGMQAESTTNDTQTTNRATISSIEQAGGFTIEHDHPQSAASGGANGMDGASASDAQESDREALLAGIENPTALKAAPMHETYTEPLIDHLLANPVATTEQKVQQKVIEAPANLPTGSDTTSSAQTPSAASSKLPPLTTPPKPKIDPYKEAV